MFILHLKNIFPEKSKNYTTDDTFSKKVMEETHVNAVMILGQVFNKDHEYYDFGGQDVTRR